MQKVGLVGCGGVSNVHLDVYSLLGHRIEVAGVCDLDFELAKRTARKHGVNRVFADYNEMLKALELDFIDVCTPTVTHPRIAIDAAKAGCNILVEKPMARTVKECEEMIAEAAQRGVSLCVCHNKRFSRCLQRTKQITEHPNWATSLSYVRSRYGNRPANHKPWMHNEANGGILWESGTHTVYVQMYLLGEIDEVLATSNQANAVTDRSFCIILHSKSGALGIIDLIWGQTDAEEFYCRLDSTRGEQVEADLFTDFFMHTGARGHVGFAVDWTRKILDDLKRFYGMRISYAGHYSSGPSRFFRRTHLELINQFSQSLKEKTTPPVTTKEGLETIRILEAIEKSLKERRAVKV
jgi:predicted dehydrogenase